MTRSRKILLQVVGAASLPLLLAACATVPSEQQKPAVPVRQSQTDDSPQRYGAVQDEPFKVPAVSLKQFDPKYRRQLVDNPTQEAPGTIVVDPKNRFLYLILDGGKALRYGVGVGRAGMEWSGEAKVAYKREWPRWTPTPNMIARDPDRYRKWENGMEGGETNPLGARALYLFDNGEDTLYRIHGTNEPWSIGKNMSSGCIRMMNQDVIDLYRRVSAGAKVVVLPV